MAGAEKDQTSWTDFLKGQIQRGKPPAASSRRRRACRSGRRHRITSKTFKNPLSWQRYSIPHLIPHEPTGDALLQVKRAAKPQIQKVLPELSPFVSEGKKAKQKMSESGVKWPGRFRSRPIVVTAHRGSHTKGGALPFSIFWPKTPKTARHPPWYETPFGRSPHGRLRKRGGQLGTFFLGPPCRRGKL